jgi:nucleoside-diphosphate-sugar epimerase
MSKFLENISGAIITGGGGFLGSHIAEHLLKSGVDTVVCVDNFCTGQKSNFDYLKNLVQNNKCSDSIHLIEANVTMPWTWLEGIKTKKISHIFHFASPASPPHYQRLAKETMWVNSWGLEQAMQAADQYGARVVFASTSEIYGDPEIHPQPETYWGHVNTIGVRSCYDEAKRFGESLIFTHNLKNNTRHGFVRIFNTYGPRMNPEDGRVIINFLVQAKSGQSLTVYGSGAQTRSFCYVDDLVRGIIAYACQSDLTEPVNLGNENEFTILQLAEVVKEIFSHKKLEIIYHPLPQDDPKQRRPSLKKAREILGWEPKVQLKQGLELMLKELK